MTRTCPDCDETMDSVAYWTHPCPESPRRKPPRLRSTTARRPAVDDLPPPNRDAVVWA